MSDQKLISEAAADFRRHFDQYYLGVIPRFLNEEGMVLAFVATLTAIESLAGVYMSDGGAGERFRAFVSAYFPKTYEPYTGQPWRFRNRMVHSFNPTPFLIVCHQSRMHLREASGIRMLNAEDLYADVVGAARAYFAQLYSDPDLQQRFSRCITADDGGRPQAEQIIETVRAKSPAD